VVVEMRLETATGMPESIGRTTSVSAYVDLPIAEVFARFSDPGIDGLLGAAMRSTLASSGEGELLSIHAWPTVWVATGTVRVPITWRLRSSDGHVYEGSATICLLMVQSGQDAITELLVTLPVDGEGPEAVEVSAATDATHRILDELTRRLESRVS